VLFSRTVNGKQIICNTSASDGNDSSATSLRINAVVFYGEVSDLDME
jgi:hypothetical protein